MIISETFPQWAERRSNNDEPKKTKKHKDWFRLVDGKLSIKNN